MSAASLVDPLPPPDDPSQSIDLDVVRLAFEDADTEAEYSASRGPAVPLMSGAQAAGIVAGTWLGTFAISLVAGFLGDPLAIVLQGGCDTVTLLLTAALLFPRRAPQHPQSLQFLTVVGGVLAIANSALVGSHTGGGALETLLLYVLLFGSLFPWPWSVTLSLLCCSGAVQAQLGAVGAVHPGGNGGGEGALWLGAHARFATWAACVALAHRCEHRARVAFQTQKHLEAVCLHMAQDGPDACISYLKTPLLPQAVRMALRIIAAEAASLTQAAAGAAGNAKFIPRSPVANQCALGDLGRQATTVLDPLSHYWLRAKPGTLLMCRMPFRCVTDLPEFYEHTTMFFTEIMVAAQQFHGIIHSLGCEEVVLSWNLFQFHPTHQSQACHCALNIQERIEKRLGKQCHIVLASAHFVAGVVDLHQHQTAIIHGRFFHAARRLLQLNGPLACGILMTENVHEAVQGSFATLSLDHVHPEGLEHPTKLYGLLPRPPFVAPQHDLFPFKQGFSCLLEGDFQDAQRHFQQFLATAPPDLAPYATRLLGIAAHKANAEAEGDDDADEFCRSDGWEPDRLAEPVLMVTRPETPEDTPDADRQPLRCLFSVPNLRLSALEQTHDEPEPNLGRHSQPGSGKAWRRTATPNHPGQVRVLSPPKGAVADAGILHRRQLAWTAGKGPEPVGPPAAVGGERRASALALDPNHGANADNFTWRRTSSRRLSTWSYGSDDNPISDVTDAPMPLVGNAIPFMTTNQRLWYCTDTLLGAGGFAGVYLGMSEEGLLVAIKQMETAPEKNAQLLNEIKLLSKFQHEHIVAYLGSAVVGPHVMVVMEYASTSVAKVLAGFGKLQLTCAKRYTRDITRGLKYLHSNDVIHRDIKPQNVLLGQTGSCKLADFGTAALLHKVEQGGESIIGTPHYMSPETLRGQVGPEADVWALGVTLWEMLTGTMLNDSQQMTNVAAVMFRLGMMTDAPQIPHDFSDDAKGFLQGCLKVEPGERATAQQLLNHPFLL